MLLSVLVTAVLQVLPNQTYKKYIRFFTGLVMILLMTTPILKIMGMEKQIGDFADETAYEEKIEEIEKATEYLGEVRIEESQKEEEDNKIEVEEIVIGNGR